MLLKSDNGPALALGGVLPLYWTASDGLGRMPAGKIEAYVHCCKNKTEKSGGGAAEGSSRTLKNSSYLHLCLCSH